MELLSPGVSLWRTHAACTNVVLPRAALLYITTRHAPHGLHPTAVTQYTSLVRGRALAPCGGIGGFIAGSKELVELLKFTAGGFVFSCGMTPAAAAAALTALKMLRREPDRVELLRKRAQLFASLARKANLDIGTVLLGSSAVCVLSGVVCVSAVHTCCHTARTCMRCMRRGLSSFFSAV